MADTKQQIELECRQVQEHLLRLIAEREMLQKEFERITSCSQHLLQQIQDDSSQASDIKQTKYDSEKQILEEKLKALEVDILEKDQRLEFLDNKASEYLLQVSTFSNSLYDSVGNNIGEDFNMEKEEEVAEISEKIVNDEIVKQSEPIDTTACCPELAEASSELECINTPACGSELQDISSNDDISKVSHDMKLNVEVKTVINLVMEEVPVVDGKVSGEGLEMSEACSKAILTTNQVIENIQEKIEGNDTLDIPVDKGETQQLIEIIKRNDNSDVCGNDNEVEVEKGKEKDEIIKENEMVLDDKMNREFVDGESNIGDGENSSLNSRKLGAMEESKEQGSFTKGVSDIFPTSDGAGKQSSGSGSPVREQMMSLSLLVAELRRVKDDMGKCMSVKEQSFIELEDQLQAANREVASLKVSMSQMSKNLEEKEQSYQALEEEHIKKKTDIERKMTELQEVTNKCSMLSSEKSDILRKMEVLEIMMTEYRTEIEMLIAEKAKVEEQTKELLSAQVAASVAEAEIDSRTNVEEKEKEIEELVEKIQSMEKQMKELNDKLKVTNKHLKVMAREREHKQKECEVLKHKVELVELKMCELQGTFDMLVKAVMVERDELIKEMEEKNGHIDDMHRTLVQLKDAHEQELEKVMHEKKVTDEELGKYKSGQLKATAMIEQTKFDALSCEKEKLAYELKQKNEQKNAMERHLKTIQDEMDVFVSTLKLEMARMKEECEKTKLEKKCVEETFASLQAEHLDMAAKHQSMENSFQDLEKSNKEKTANLEVLKLQLDDLQQQLEDLNTKNFNLSSEMYSKEEEFREELSAREGTIQELNVTLTNNQKQSMENYNALQEDLTTLQTKFKSSVEENKRQVKEMEDKLRQSQEEKKKEVLDLQDKVKSLVDELKESRTDLAESQTTSHYQECESPSVSQDAELQSSSLAVVPSLPLDTVGGESSTSNSLRMEAECREVDNKVQQLEALKKREKELEDLLEATQKKLEAKETEMQSLIQSDIPQLNKKIKELTAELENLKGSSPVSEGFKSQAEFEAVIARKEEKIRDLESKVSELELSLVNKNGYISQLEGRLEGSGEVENNVDSHLEQIHKLSADISKLKEELEKTHGKCETLQHTVDQLESDKQNIEREKAKCVEEFESKLQLADNNLEGACADLKEKKKLG